MTTVAILLFDDVEVLDACGPFEVFATTKRQDGELAFRVVTVSPGEKTVTAVGGLRLLADFTLDDCPDADVLVIPGGVGRKREVDNPALIHWIAARAPRARIVLSVCTGAFLLERAGLLRGLAVTTHFSALDELAEVHTTGEVRRDCRLVHNGSIVTAAGISAGIDASLHVVARLCGEEVAIATARRMEYRWSR
ncbi:DJ-1/PfpI family protein [bacterium]|nr:DJ-1/PfpI family protein [bacterium]